MRVGTAVKVHIKMLKWRK